MPRVLDEKCGFKEGDEGAIRRRREHFAVVKAGINFYDFITVNFFEILSSIDDDMDQWFINNSVIMNCEL